MQLGSIWFQLFSGTILSLRPLILIDSEMRVGAPFVCVNHMKSPSALTSFLVLVAALGCLSQAVYADMVTLSPVADTTLFEHDPNNNLGANSTLVIGTTAGVSGPASRSRALMKFDVAGTIPTNATITS